jgi:transposase
MRINKKPGERMETDWAGQTAFIRDNITGDSIPMYIFVAVLPASQYSYVEAFICRNLESWITAHIHAFTHFDGVPRMIVPDNLRTGVDKVEWYTPVINRTYHEMAEHYGTAIVPARVRKPKDKPSVESTVGDISTWIIAALRNQTYFSVNELNGDISKKLTEYNDREFQKRPGSRKSVFVEEERDLLLPLPVTPYEIATWKKAMVAFNYHICVDSQYYSIPHEYIRHQVDIRVTSRIVEVFYNGHRITSHPRLTGYHGQYQTLDEHMPQKHRKTSEWSAERFISWAQKMGTNVAEVIRSVLADCKVEQQGYRTCMGILKMSDKYGVERLEAACARALSYTPHPTYRNLSTILKSGQDKISSPKTVKDNAISERHSFVRGAKYYGGDDHAE